MFKETTEAFKIRLDGDWSMSGVAERFPLLAKQISLLSNSQTLEGLQPCASHALPEIDLAGIDALDACGCQLLALFIGNLRQIGKAPLVTNIPDAFRSKIHFLGFGHEFNLSH